MKTIKFWYILMTIALSVMVMSCDKRTHVKLSYDGWEHIDEEVKDYYFHKWTVKGTDKTICLAGNKNDQVVIPCDFYEAIK